VATARKREPEWLGLELVLAIHEGVLASEGGLAGVRDEGLLASALDRPRNKWGYEETADLHALAAAYGFGIAKNHPFADANKRTAFQTMFVFLYVNGLLLDADEVKAVLTMVALAEGKVSEPKLATWLRANARKRGSSE
jgi:death-on-curing protein